MRDDIEERAQHEEKSVSQILFTLVLICKLGNINDAEYDSNQNYSTSDHMLGVMLEPDAAGPEEHLKRDKELKECDQ